MDTMMCTPTGGRSKLFLLFALLIALAGTRGTPLVAQISHEHHLSRRTRAKGRILDETFATTQWVTLLK